MPTKKVTAHRPSDFEWIFRKVTADVLPARRGFPGEKAAESAGP